MERISKKELLRRYVAGECSNEEIQWVEKWYLDQEDNLPLSISQRTFKEDINEIYSKINPEERKKKLKASTKISIAAALIGLFVIIGMYTTFNNQEVNSEKQVVFQDILPGINQTTLLLSNGSEVLLDDLVEGDVLEDEDTNIMLVEKGQIKYKRETQNGKLVYHELQTYKGSQYMVILSDGTKVWLNAASKFRYPIQFESNQRVVELTGEAYFEVAKSNTPFKVITDQQEINVLGTSFNVKSYKEEATSKTTLLEGSVKIITKAKENLPMEFLMKPGEQVITNKGVGDQLVEVKPLHAIAWRSGLFSFQGEDLSSVMREFSRWYGVDVKFDGELPDTKLWGDVYRNVSATQALKVLEYFGLDYKITETKGIQTIEVSEK